MADIKKNPPPVFTREELIVISNALNEVCNGLPFGDDEFATRIGFPREFAHKVHAKVNSALGPSTDQARR